MIPLLFLLFQVPVPTFINALTQTRSEWRSLPHIDKERRDILLTGGVSIASTVLGPKTASATTTATTTTTTTTTNNNNDDNNNKSMKQEDATTISPPPPSIAGFGETGSSNKSQPYRSISSIESNIAIPVWPTWGGGKVVPVSLGGKMQDPFLLLAHHDHWFDPKDPLREPFKGFGKITGLPYIDVEGFSLHPHRGFDILTYILDGSDGFKHKDSTMATKDTSKVYRGGCAQWMRTGSGVLHEEFWETRDDRRTNIELFQLWINLPAKQKFDTPAIKYIGKETDFPWEEQNIYDPTAIGNNSNRIVVGKVRNIGATLNKAIQESGGVIKERTSLQILHATLNPGARWIVPDAKNGKSSAVLYVRKGVASFDDDDSNSVAATYSSAQTVDEVQVTTTAKAHQSVTFAPDKSELIAISNCQKDKVLDILLLIDEPLNEPVAQSGPIVMNTPYELNDAYRQLSDGTFLDRDRVLHQQARTSKFQRQQVL